MASLFSNSLLRLLIFMYAIQSEIETAGCGSKKISCVTKTTYKECSTFLFIWQIPIGSEIACEEGYTCNENEGDIPCLVEHSTTVPSSTKATVKIIVNATSHAAATAADYNQTVVTTTRAIILTTMEPTNITNEKNNINQTPTPGITSVSTFEIFPTPSKGEMATTINLDGHNTSSREPKKDSDSSTMVVIDIINAVTEIITKEKQSTTKIPTSDGGTSPSHVTIISSVFTFCLLDIVI